MNVQHAMLCLVVDYITPAVNGDGRGMRLGTCLVQQQCVFCAVASAACMIANKCCVFFLYFIALVVHGHGRGTRLGTCLVQLQCVSCVIASAACVAPNKCCALFLISLHLLCTGMDEACALVRALCSCNVSSVPWPLLHA